MRYYTSYIGMSKKIPSDILQVSIMRWCPDYYKPDMELKGLAPKEEDLRAFKDKKISQMEFTRRYCEKVLSQFKPSNMDKYFNNLDNKPNGVAFICVEKPDEFCHRHLLAYYLKQHGIDIEEFKGLDNSRGE